MERSHPVGPGAITEFDRLFDIGCRGIVRCVVLSSRNWEGKGGKKRKSAREKKLIDCMEKVAEMLLRRWLAHADLPWSPASCLKLWRKYRGAGLPTDQVLDQLARLQARKLARLDMTAKLFPPSGE